MLYNWLFALLIRLQFLLEGGDELTPADGGDDVYDSIMTNISELEQALTQQLKKFEKSLG